MIERRAVLLVGSTYEVTFEDTASGGWSAHTVEPEVVGGLGDTLEAALRDWEEAMRHWLKYAQESSVV